MSEFLDILYYKKKYSDLGHMNNLELKIHFENHGKNENRLFNKKLELLDIKSYTEKYNLFKKSNYEIFVHFLNNKDEIKLLEDKDKNKFNLKSYEKCNNYFKFVNICLKNIPIINLINLPKIYKDRYYETVFIEFRILLHIEYIIKNTILKLPNWSHTIICGNINYDYIKKITKKIDTINIIKLDINNLTQNEYNNLLYEKTFWENFKGKKLLIYQQDSFLFHTTNINNFLKYDYIGAPWPKHQDDNKNLVGNGGFSIRTKDKMLEVINLSKDIVLGESTKEYMINTNLDRCPEDVYFSKTLIDYNLGLVSNRETALLFSQELEKSVNPIGGHQFYLAGENLKVQLNTFMLLDDNYYKNVDHRGGWKNVINYLFKKQVINKSGNILLLDNTEKYFLWEQKQSINVSWYGMIHMTVKCSDEFKNTLDINKLINNSNFIKSLPYCNGLIVFSKVVEKYLKQINFLKKIRIKCIYHPIVSDIIEFNLINYFKEEYSLVLLGQQLRNISDIYKINNKIIKNKIWLSGIKDENEFKLRYNKLMKDDLINKYTENFEEYDNIIKNEINLIPLYDASANNSILEIIQSCTPAFVTRLEATEEYLGKDYPMFYVNTDEINFILNNHVLFVNKIIKTYFYLKNLNKDKIQIEYFTSEVLKFINEIN